MKLIWSASYHIIPNFCAVGVFAYFNVDSWGAFSTTGKSRKEIAHKIVKKALSTSSFTRRRKILFCDRVKGMMSKHIINQFADGETIKIDARVYQVRKIAPYKNPNTRKMVQEMHVHWVTAKEAKEYSDNLSSKAQSSTTVGRKNHVSKV